MRRDIKFLAYGTLRRGGSNENVLENAILTEAGITLSGYAMYHDSIYPFVVEDKSRQIICDVFSLPQNSLSYLDRFEGSFYKRVIVHSHQAFLYIKSDNNIKGYKKIPGGDWLSKYY
jgi:gamma-glutamylcyclotransferase (GGCT)/AIG2-like uncharacterized protein YtfP